MYVAEVCTVLVWFVMHQSTECRFVVTYMNNAIVQASQSYRNVKCCTYFNLHSFRGPAESQDEDSDDGECGLHGDS